MGQKRVVVTGMGAITPLGSTIDQFWSNLIAGKSGIDFVTKVNKDDFPAKVAGEIKDFDPILYMDKKMQKNGFIYTVCFSSS